MVLLRNCYVRKRTFDFISICSHSYIFVAGNKNRRRKPGQEASRFKEDEATGKMVIDDEDAQEEEGYEEEDIAGVAYKETLTSVDGFRRDARGRVKFNKDTKKRRANEEEEDVEMGDATGVSNAPSGKSNKKQKKEFRLGKEFKAKVRFFVFFLGYLRLIIFV